MNKRHKITYTDNFGTPVESWFETHGYAVGMAESLDAEYIGERVHPLPAGVIAPTDEDMRKKYSPERIRSMIARHRREAVEHAAEHGCGVLDSSCAVRRSQISKLRILEAMR